MKKKLVGAWLIVCCFSASPVLANLYCSGTVSKLYVNKSGEVWVNGTWRTDDQFTMICDLDTTWNDLSPSDCKNWFPMLQGALHAATPVTIYYPLSGTANCTELLTNSNSPAPHYVVLGN